MRTSRAAGALAAAALSLTALVATSAPAEAAPVKYKNCKALNSVYKHGVGRSGAKDHTSGKRVTTFKRSTTLYKANKRLDRDRDGIACEKR
jgi:uncharacterized membrane protein